MKKKKKKLEVMLEQLERIIERALLAEGAYKKQLKKVHPHFLQSAKNLIYYRAMRARDIRSLQKKLGWLGFSRLAKAESHVMSSLFITRSILTAMTNDDPLTLQQAPLKIKDGNKKVKTNASALLGQQAIGRRTRIMVTLPTHAANNYQMVEQMILAGMNCARINCAHDGPEIWAQMASNVRKASAELDMECLVAMDLGGPKIRTGSLAPGPKVRKLRPPKNRRGEIVKPLEAWISPSPPADDSLSHIPVFPEYTNLLEPGRRMFFRDARNKKRELEVISVEEDGAVAQLHRTAYIETGMKLYLDKKGHNAICVADLPAQEASIILHTGEKLILHKPGKAGQPAVYSADGELEEPAHIACTAEEIIGQVKVGDPILFDDGQIKAEVAELHPDHIVVEVVYTKEGGGKLRADKGINLPYSELSIRGLTEKDKKDLPYVVEYADIVNLSFVNTARDVLDLLDVLDKLGAKEKMGIILKIETQQGFDNLLDILLTAMQTYPVGVMIARGDLAIESGWENIGRVQEEILSLCQAAHIPDIWATQVLENLAKLGIPSRAEITDAVMAQRAECVMLNKGGYILEAIRLLDTILRDMEPYQDKNAPMLPALKKVGKKKTKKKRQT
jgi:pyruvate kinase